MYAIQQMISKDVMSLKKSIRLPLHDFIRKASPSRQRLVIPETRKAHSGTDRPRGPKIRHRGTGTAGWHSTRHLTQAQVTRVVVALRKVAVGAAGSTNSRETNHNALKRASPTKSATDCAADRCTEQPVASNRLPTLQNPLR